MMRSALVAIASLAWCMPSSPAHADEFTIELAARVAKESKGVAAAFPVAKPAPRVVLVAGADTPVTVNWTVRNVDKTGIVKDVLIHFFVVQEEKLDQQELPKLTKTVTVESALTMDFRPQDKSAGEITFSVPRAGYYLIRVELQGTAAKEKHEPFAALDLHVR